jgi:molybdopterin synthase catalytic subunit
MRSTRVRVLTGPIDQAELVGFVASSAAGATVLFLGTVRDHSEGKEGITHLDYEVYLEEVERVIDGIVGEACERWQLEGVAVDHRVGTVTLGEASVAVAVSAAHRSDAFGAARYLIDELKQRAPIWKKEHWPGGAEWSRGS